MPEYCYTATQIRLIRAAIIAMMGISIFQSIAIRRLEGKLKRGRLRYESLKEGAEYLVTILEANQVNLTDFDVIALNNILEGNGSVTIQEDADATG